MADLNDFFARKDKRKAKNAKYTTLNNIDQKLKVLDQKREKAQRHCCDDEWNPFEEKKIDYTGLKIQNTTLQEVEEDVESDKDGEESSCPWNTISEIQVRVEDDNTLQRETRAWKTIEAPVQQEKPPAPVVKAYIPPHLRNKPKPPPTAGTGRFNKVKGLQDENIENMFPSLPAIGSANTWEKKTRTPETNNGPKLTLENRFGALNNSD